MPEARVPMVALLRAVNVGGARVPMADLRTLLDREGLGEVRTHLQSGNVIVTASSADPSRVSKVIEKVIGDWLGLSIRVIVRNREEMAKVVDSNPFVEAGMNPTMLHAVFLESKPSVDRVAGLDPDRSPPDRFTVSDREIYVHYRDGSGRSKLDLSYFERKLGVSGTARNWNTVTRLLDMLGE
jgi:uncharacterized protein (DUF1697 family)